MKNFAVSLLVLAAAVSNARAASPGGSGVGKPLWGVALPAGARSDSRVTLSPDAALAPEACDPTDTIFCANNGRFRVQVVFSAPGLGIPESPAHAAALTGDTGYFWFFSPNNVELVVKVVDGRAFNGFYWVFYGALSNVSYTVTVTDTQTGVVKVYPNAEGTLASVADTAAFTGGPTCTYAVSPANPATFGAAGGTGMVSVTTQAGCAWNAVSNSPFISIVAPASNVGNGSIAFSVATNSSAASRTGSLSVAGETISITQAGTSPGQYDGSWSGTTSQACTPTSGSAHLCSLSFVVSNNALVRVGIGFAGPVCGVTDAFATISPETPQLISGNSFQLAAMVTPSSGVAATITLNGTFDSPTSSTGNGSVRITTSSPMPSCSTTIPISFTAIRN